MMLAVARPYKKPYTKRRKTFIPGVDRTGGYYGRYSGRDGELKFHDVTLDDAVIATAANIGTGTINVIPQGVGEEARVGRKCTIKSIMWRYKLTLPKIVEGGAAEGDSVRMILYVDKQCNGAAASPTDIVTPASNIHGFRDLVNGGRFKILMDKMFTINPTNGASESAGTFSSSGVLREGQFYKTCNIPLEFDGVTGAVSEIRSNNINVWLISSGNKIGLESRFRLRFSDY